MCTGANDIALIRKVAPAKLNPGVGVVCLPGVDGSDRFDDNQFGLVTAVVGWGQKLASVPPGCQNHGNGRSSHWQGRSSHCEQNILC